VAFAPDGRTLAAGLSDGSIILADPDTAARRATVAGHEAFVVGLSFSPDSRTLASACFDGSVKLWRMPRSPMVEQNALSVSDQPIRFVVYAPDGKTFVTSGSDQVLRFWDASDVTRGARESRAEHLLGCAAFSPDGRVLVTGDEQGKLVLWDPATGKPQKELESHSGLITGVAFAPDGKRLVSAGLDRKVLAWNTATWEVRGEFPGATGLARSVAFWPDGKTVAVSMTPTGATEGAWMVFDADSMQQRSKVTFDSPVSAASLSPDGRTLAALLLRRRPGARGFDLIVCDAVSGARRRVLEHHAYALRVAFAPDGKTLAAGLVDGTIVIWDLDTGSRLQEVKGHQVPISGLAFAPDGHTLVSGASDGTVKLWRID
jgi:WD40 repeat protein